MKIKKFFNKRKHPKEQYVYTVTDGSYKGTTILFFDLETEQDPYITLAIGENESAYGGMRLLEIPKKSVEEGFSKKILVKMGKLPNKLWNVFHEEYKERIARKNESNN